MSLIRLRHIPKLLRFQSNQLTRCIGTSKVLENQRWAQDRIGSGVTYKPETEQAALEALKPKEKVWISYGYNLESEYLDRHAMHLTFFCAVSVVICFGSFLLAYAPDYKLKDWACREGYIELRRREQLGLPLIDPNFIDPSKFTLPTDEELGDTEIYI